MGKKAFKKAKNAIKYVRDNKNKNNLSDTEENNQFNNHLRFQKNTNICICIFYTKIFIILFYYNCHTVYL